MRQPPPAMSIDTVTAVFAAAGAALIEDGRRRIRDDSTRRFPTCRDLPGP